MGLVLIIEDDDKNPQGFRLRSGQRIGRQASDITVKDPKMSSQHAEIQQDSLGRFRLVDLNSANKIKVDNEKLEELALSAGSKFELGNTKFRVEDEIKSLPRWKSQLNLTLEKLSLSHLNTASKGVFPFHSPLKLRFQRGKQYGTSWDIGFGPRYFGTNSPEFSVHEFDIDPCGFELEPHGEGILYKTQFPLLVRLNGRPISSETIKAGDLVEIADSLIEISY